MKIGIVDVGGGLRGIYAAGVLDYCLDQGIRFDIGIGVSAGSANIISFIAGQARRNYPFYVKYPFRKEYMSAGNLLRKGSYLDLDYIYGTLSVTGGENPLDYERFLADPMWFLAVATDARTGLPKYFTKSDIPKDDYSVLKASSAIPGVCRPYRVNGVPYFDGALGDTIPIEKAFQWGCDKVVLLLTKPRDVLRTPDKDRKLAQLIQPRYPRAAEKMRQRADSYNRGVALAKEYEAQGRVLIVAPDDTCGVDTLKKDKTALHKLYKKGYADGPLIQAFIGAAGESGGPETP